MGSKMIAIAMACALVTALSGQTPSASRIAAVEDVAGVKTDVSDPSANFDGWERFSDASGCFSLTMPDYELAIPVDRIVSVVVSGKAAKVIVDWRGQQRTVSGTLKGSLTGKSDFGDFELVAEKIRQLAFKSPPAEQQAARSGQSGTLLLKNGQQIQLAAIERYDSYYSSEGYIMGGSMRYMHYDDVSLMRGESVATVKFADLQRLEFDKAGAITVTLKNGNSATGKLASGDGAGVKGWTGESDSGFVFVSPESVRAVVFGNTTAARQGPSSANAQTGAAKAAAQGTEIVTSFGSFTIEDVEVGNKFPPGCGEPGPGCSPAQPGYKVLMVWLKPKGDAAEAWHGLMKLSGASPANNVYVKSDDGGRTDSFSGGMMNLRPFVAFTPPAAGKNFVLYWEKNPPISLGK